jgi:hypothetical protein
MLSASSVIVTVARTRTKLVAITLLIRAAEGVNDRSEQPDNGPPHLSFHR